MTSSLAAGGRPATFRLVTLFTVLVLAVAPAAVGSFPSPAPPPIPVAVRTAAAAVVGGVPFPLGLGRFGCLACAGIMIGIGGTSLLGAAIATAAWPRYAAWCAVGCYNVFR